MSKVNRFGEEVSELRGNVPKALIALIDAEAIAETRLTGHVVSRNERLIHILIDHFNPKIDESIVMLKLLNINPICADQG